MEGCDLKYLELISAAELLLGWRENCAILERIDQILQMLPAIRRQEDKGFLIANKDYKFRVLGIKKAVIIDLAT